MLFRGTALIVLLFAFNLIFSLSAYAQGVHGVMRVVKGEVQVKSGKNGQKSRARVGQKVFPKDTIITGQDARAKIVMIDNNEINVSPDSEVTFEKYEYKPGEEKKDVLINVIYGKVRSKVEQKYDGKESKFQVKTPSAVAGVRGTDFLTSYDQKSKVSNVVTFHGKVEFGVPGPGGTIVNAVPVSVGQAASVAPGQAPSAPTSIPQNELKSIEVETSADTDTSAGTSSGPAANTPAQSRSEPPSEDKITIDKQDVLETKPSDRTPASAAAPESSAPPRAEMPAPPLPPPPTAPAAYIPPIPEIPKCTFCDQVIEGGNVNVKVIINN